MLTRYRQDLFFLLNSIRNQSKLNLSKVEAELLKEKSKVELIERELKSREQIMRVVISEKNRQASKQLGIEINS